MVKKGNYGDGEAVLSMIYGKEDESLNTANLRRRFRDLAKADDGPTARQEKKWLVEGLQRDLLKWNTAWLAYLDTIREPRQAELKACFVPKGKAWRAAMRQAASLDQRIEKKMRLYWDTQEKDRQRIVRQHEESKLEATPEEVAADQEAKEFTGRLMGVIQEMNAKLKAAAEARRAASAGETGPEAAGGGSHLVGVIAGLDRVQAHALFAHLGPGASRLFGVLPPSINLLIR
ncbi:MAG: hypothetical protein ACLQOO_19905 [Terriglobia bacterium]